ncbi:Conjugal transfer protein TrbC [Rhodomicrobium vannielii ATCC 17100]|uniref:Conjugal transfer protein TrbC n=1 Tax=Rhodomicrobium vannielii (strain ATCC 17100 / DSM 162 / LMG 4299 / NCIMB 10020 / ATH 3.1.1) TaxID=648757 RepID=E3I3K2_RHOVT|nr:TrbC/VirB2 family protein [Rhodomicrobium vannielii]ADP70349.1 Conjugal transfer protein TrbC [Rhodomicrobium vannielii ATCC 17100]
MRKAPSDFTAFWSLALTALLFLLIAFPEHAFASSTGSGLQWETPLQKLRDSITGPVAYAVSLMGIVVTGAILVFGGEINEFVRRVIMLVLVVSLMVFATDLLSTLFSAGAVI